ncbi:MAG: hypothetical protein Q9219_001448 [cf. Caloplaca sp. 3 TL-2023]
MPSLPTSRFHGDGLDFRRPAHASTAPGVIDLTDENSPNETRLRDWSNTRVDNSPIAIDTVPDNFRNIIDLDLDLEGEGEGGRDTVNHASQSPDLELLEVRPIRSQIVGDPVGPQRHERTHPGWDLQRPGPRLDNMRKDKQDINSSPIKTLATFINFFTPVAQQLPVITPSGGVGEN